MAVTSLSESNDNPNALIEVSDDLAAFIAGDEAPASPVDIAPAAPAPTETAPAVIAPTDDVPEWFADVPEDKRAATVQRMIESLPPEQRSTLPAIQETARAATQQTAAQVSRQTVAQQAQAQRDAELTQAASNFAADLVANLHPDSELDVEAGLNNVITVAQAQYHDGMASGIEQGLLQVINWLGLQEIPQATLNAIAAAPTYGDVIRAYCELFANRAYDLGKIAQKNEAGQISDVDKAAMTARYKAWGIAEAAKSGRVRIAKDVEGLLMELISDTPVPLGSGGETGGDVGDLTQEEFDKAVADPDFYETLMANPSKKAAWGRAIAESMASA